MFPLTVKPLDLFPYTSVQKLRQTSNNMRLKEIYEKNGEEYFHKLKYLILQILSTKIFDKEIIEVETKYKKRFLTREFGLK